MDPEKVNYPYCDDLPTAPLPENKKILVTGASGYVARRLIPELVSRGNIYWSLLWKFHARVFKQMLKFFYKESVRPDGAEAEA